MLKPMLLNYLGLLTASLTDQSALEMCGTVRKMLDYVEYGDGIEKPQFGGRVAAGSGNIINYG